MEQAKEKFEWMDLQTGEIVEESNEIDYMIAEWNNLKRFEGELYQRRKNIEMRFGALAREIETDSATRRVAGEKYTIKVEIKKREKWDLKALEAIRRDFTDEVFCKYFRVKEYAPNRKELKKLQSTAGDKPQQLAKIINAAQTIEEGGCYVSND